MAKDTGTSKAAPAAPPASPFASIDAREIVFSAGTPTAGAPMPIDPLIRAAIERKRGGFKGATDEEIRRFWNELDEEQRAEVLRPDPPVANGQ